MKYALNPVRLAIAKAFGYAVVATLVVVCMNASAEATLLSYESMSYTPTGSDLLAKNGGTGWSGAWYAEGYAASIHNNYDIGGGSLTPPTSNSTSTGNRVTTLQQSSISGIRRDFAAPIDSQTTATRYLSVLLRPEAPLNSGIYNGFFGVYLDGYGLTNDVLSDDVYFGKPGGGNINQWSLETRGGIAQQSSPAGVVLNQTALLVLKAEFRPGLDRFTLFVNPTPGQPEPTLGIVKTDLDLGSVPGLVLYSSGPHSVDELRWGTTFADVTPVPEPSAIIMAAVGGALLLGVRPFGSKRRSG